MAGKESKTSSSKASMYTIMIVSIAAFGGVLFGYDTGVISGAILFIKPVFSLGDAMEGLVVSTVTLGALFGAVAAGTLTDSFGRRRIIIVSSLVFIVGSAVSSLAPQAMVLIMGRFIIGLAVGISSVAVPMYIAEIAQARVRGSLVSLFQLAITLGILLAYVVDEVFSKTQDWRAMLALAAVPALLLMAGMCFMPESPRWLIKTGRPKEALSSLKLVREPQRAGKEMEEIRRDLSHEEKGSWSNLLKPAMRPALTVGIGLAVFQQVTGINTIIYYAPEIFQRAGYQAASVAILATTGIGIANVLSTFIAIWLVDRAGRRPLLLAGLMGMVASLFVLGLSFHSAGRSLHGPITVACLALYIVFFAFSLGPLVWLMISEIYPNRIRGLAVGLSTASNWAANFLVTLTFPVLLGSLGTTSTFWLFAGLGIAALLFVWRRVPETKGLTLEEIEKVWH